MGNIYNNRTFSCSFSRISCSTCSISLQVSNCKLKPAHCNRIKDGGRYHAQPSAAATKRGAILWETFSYTQKMYCSFDDYLLHLQSREYPGGKVTLIFDMQDSSLANMVRILLFHDVFKVSIYRVTQKRFPRARRLSYNLRFYVVTLSYAHCPIKSFKSMVIHFCNYSFSSPSFGRCD